MGKTMRFDKDQMESLHKYYVAKNKAKKNRKNKGDNMVNIKGDKIEVYEEKENKGGNMENVNLEASLKAGLEAMDKGEMPARELTDAEKAQLEESLKAYEAAAIAAKDAVFAAIENSNKENEMEKTTGYDMNSFDRDFAHLTDEQKVVAKKFIEEHADDMEVVRKYAEETADNGGSKWLRRLGYVAATAVVAVGGYALYKKFAGESVAEEAVAELIESFRK